MNAREIAEKLSRYGDVLRRCGEEPFPEHHLAKAYLSLESRIAVLEEALRWYADETNWFEDHAKIACSNAEDDQGERARKALAEGGEK